MIIKCWPPSSKGCALSPTYLSKADRCRKREVSVASPPQTSSPAALRTRRPAVKEHAHYLMKAQCPLQGDERRCDRQRVDALRCQYGYI